MEIKTITKEMYEALKRPLDAKAVTKHPTKTYLSSIKAIYVTERLNDVFGCGTWQIRTEKISENDKGMIVVKTTLTIPQYGVYYESFGGNDNGGDGNKNFDLGDAYKGATTDAITKICSYMGIGIEVFKGNVNVAPKQPTDTQQKAKEYNEMLAKADEEKKRIQKELESATEKKLKDCKTEIELRDAYKSLSTELQLTFKNLVIELKKQFV